MLPLRIVLCMMPQNQWLSATIAPLAWGIYRNIPFALLGLLIIVLFYRSAKGAQRQGFPLDVADHRAELRLLYPRGAVGRHRSP